MKAILTLARRWAIYRYRRAYLKVPYWTLGMDDSKLNDEQRLGIKIVKLLASKADSEILIAPISDRYYLKNGDLFVIVSNQQISIINSVYHYDIYNTDEINRHVIKYLRRVIENRRLRFEEQMRSKIERSLSNILVNLNEKFKKEAALDSILKESNIG